MSKASESALPTDFGDYPGAEFDRRWRRLVFPDGYENPTPAARYHLAVVGAGPAGLVTAIAAAGLGAKVALIERKAMGGDCLNVGCVPSKTLLEFSDGFGDFDAAFARLREIRAEIAEHDSVERYSAAGVDVFLGSARCVDAQTLAVGDARLSARRIVIATGSRPAIPPIRGLEDARPLTNETVFDLRSKPERLAIIGGGPVGCELALALSRLGVDVVLFETADRVLAGETPAASEAVAAGLRANGVRLQLDAEISAVERRGAQVAVVTRGRETVADEVVVAAGRKANVEDLDLPAAGVETSDDGLITVDARLRTTNPKIFAAGDVCSHAKFTHNADAHARIVVRNALFAPTASTARLAVPRCTYTRPEVASVGRSRAELEAQGIEFDVYAVDFESLDRGKTQIDGAGFAEMLVAKRGGKILGATIVGRDAGEQIAVICVAMANGLGVGKLGRALLPYPTRAEYLKRIADEFNRRRLTPAVGRVLRTWLKWAR